MWLGGQEGLGSECPPVRAVPHTSHHPLGKEEAAHLPSTHMGPL